MCFYTPQCNLGYLIETGMATTQHSTWGIVPFVFENGQNGVLRNRISLPLSTPLSLPKPPSLYTPLSLFSFMCSLSFSPSPSLSLARPPPPSLPPLFTPFSSPSLSLFPLMCFLSLSLPPPLLQIVSMWASGRFNNRLYLSGESF